MTIIVTGAAGFIGSNLVKGLNERGETNIVAVDNLTARREVRQPRGLRDRRLPRQVGIRRSASRGDFGKVRAVFHEGACSDTMETDGRYMMENNYRYTLALMEACLEQGTQFLYASSAATYGASTMFREDREYERPLNVYGYSKFLFDQVVRRRLPAAHSQIVGFRYFNVYGPREYHKGRMASVAFHHFNQFRAEGSVKLFGEYNGYAPGTQSRDFVSVEDVVKVNLYFLDHPEKSGIFNLGTGRSQPFNDIAASVVNTLREIEDKPPLSLEEMVQEGLVEYVKFPDALRGKYQCFTQSDVSRLRVGGLYRPVPHGAGRRVALLQVAARA